MFAVVRRLGMRRVARFPGWFGWNFTKNITYPILPVMRLNFSILAISVGSLSALTFSVHFLLHENSTFMHVMGTCMGADTAP